MDNSVLPCPGIVELKVRTVEYLSTCAFAHLFVKKHITITNWAMWADEHTGTWAFALARCAVENLIWEDAPRRCMRTVALTQASVLVKLLRFGARRLLRADAAAGILIQCLCEWARGNEDGRHTGIVNRQRCAVELGTYLAPENKFPLLPETRLCTLACNIH